MALRQFADQPREIQHALALVGGIHTLPEAHAPSRSFWAEQRLTRRKLSHGPANAKANLPLFELARVLVCFDHVARFIVNIDHSIR
jgi:hypothetical protein